MLDLGDLVAHVVVDTGGAQAELAKFGSNGQSTLRRAAGRMASGFGDVLKKAALVTGGAVAGVLSLALVNGFKRLNSIDQAQAKLRGLGHSAKDVTSIMNNALASVKGTAFGLDEAATVAASATAAGIKPGKELTKYLKLTADTATIAGTSLGDMGSILNQVATAGKANNGNLEELSNRGIPIYQLLGKQMHVSAGAVFDLAKKGKISAKVFETALHKGVGGAALTAGNTVQGSFKNMGAALSRFGAGFLKDLFPHLQKGFVNLTKFLDNATAAVAPFAKVVGTKLGGAFERVTGVLAKMNFSSWDAFVKSVGGSRSSHVGRIVSEIAAGFAKAGPEIRDFIHGLNPGKAFDSLKTMAKGALSGIKSVLHSLPSLASGFGKGLIDFWNNLAPALGKFGGAAKTIGGTLGTVLGKALGFIADHIGTIMKVLPAFILAWLAYRQAQKGMAAAQLAYNSAALAALPLTLANNGLRVIALALERQQTKARILNTFAAQGENGAELEGSAIRKRSLIQLAVMKGAKLAAAAASKVMAAGQWLVNAAMDANPIMLVVLAVAALVAGFIIAYKHSETFRKIVHAAMHGVQVAAEAVAHWFTDKFVPFFTKTIPGVFQSVLSWVKQHWPLIVGLLINPVATVAALLIHKYHAQIVGFFSGIWSWVNSTWKSSWNKTKDILVWPVNEGRRLIGVGITGVRNIFTGASSWASSSFKRGWDRLQTILSTPVDLARKAISRILGGIRTTFHNELAAYGRIWSGLTSKLTGPVNAALSWLGQHFLGPIKSLLSGVGLGSLASKLPAFGRGGTVALEAGGTVPGWSPHDKADNIPAMLTAGEYVLPVEATRRLKSNVGPGGMEQLRKGEVPSYGLGGLVGNIWGGIKHAAGSILGSLNPASLFEKLADKLLSGAPGGMWGQVGLKVAGQAVSGLVGKVKDMIGSVLGGGAGPLGGSGLVTWLGGRFTENFANHLKRAYAMAPFHVFQGGWDPGGVAASGHTHDKDAVDVGPATLAIQNALRANGVAAWIRTPAEGFIYHVHGVPLPGAGTPSPSAAWQAQDYLHGGNGLLRGTRYASAGFHPLSEDGRPELVVGPQLRRLNAGSKVYNADQTAAMLDGAGGTVNHFTILALDPIATGRELEKVLLKTGRAVGGVSLSRQPVGVSLR